MNDRAENLRKIHEDAGRPKEKKHYVIPKVGKKKKAKLDEENALRAGDDTLMENWFKNRRKEMIGTCQCGCGMPSQKKDDTFFRHSLAHIFPKAKFESVMYHPLNWVERAFWGGCHGNMDNTSMDKWPGMADWDDIVEKFHALAPLLTNEERADKFYSHLERLVYGKRYSI